MKEWRMVDVVRVRSLQRMADLNGITSDVAWGIYASAMNMTGPYRIWERLRETLEGK